MTGSASPLEVFGDFPPVLYKLFDQEQYARDFVERGRLRLSRVQHFAEIEDSIRADQTEGEAHLRIPGDVTSVHLDASGNVVRTSTAPGYLNYQGSFVNPVFIACFSYPPNGDVRQLPHKFGSFVVRIDDPPRLAQDFTDWLTKEGFFRGTPLVECLQVRYDKGHKVAKEDEPLTRTRLSYSQKPPKFADEFEYRLAVVASPEVGSIPKFPIHHFVDLGRPLAYAELLR